MGFGYSDAKQEACRFDESFDPAFAYGGRTEKLSDGGTGFVEFSRRNRREFSGIGSYAEQNAFKRDYAEDFVSWR